MKASKEISWISKVPYLSNIMPEVGLGEYGATEVARSLNGKYTLQFQGDGNLVLYKLAVPFQNNLPAATVLWASNTYSNATYKVNFQGDGNIVCKSGWPGANNPIYWMSGITGGPNPIWILQDDGNLVGYKNHSLTATTAIILAGPFAATYTDGGRQSAYYGRMGRAN